MSNKPEVSFIEEARGFAAQCWCDKETENITMDPILAEAFAKRISLWMESAAQYHRDSEYYRGLLVKCGKYIGDVAYVSDDGSVQKDVLCAKIPELVKELTRLNAPINNLGDKHE